MKKIESLQVVKKIKSDSKTPKNESQKLTGKFNYIGGSEYSKLSKKVEKVKLLNFK
ncbi:hypothetical protein GCM10023345_15780 [Acinetobacter kookii]